MQNSQEISHNLLAVFTLYALQFYMLFDYNSSTMRFISLANTRFRRMKVC